MNAVVFMPAKNTGDVEILKGLSFLDRIQPPFNIKPCFVNVKSSLSEKQKSKRTALEGRLLLEKSEGFYRVALKPDGRQLSSKEFAFFLKKTASHKKIGFIIGGAYGLSDQVINNSQAAISLSPLTFPHRLAFLILCEQIYRTQEILRGTLYHK